VTTVDYLVVGSGLTGGTIARVLTDAHREVLVLERRSHLGGNVHDYVHASGVRVHAYGPHYFRCSSVKTWDFVNRFACFYPFEAKVKSLVNGKYENWPPNRRLLERCPEWSPEANHTSSRNFEEACLRKMPRSVYETYVQGYTRRQWGLEPHLLDPRLADRIRINEDDEIALTLTPHLRYQGLPRDGYAGLIANLLADIPRRLGVDYLKCPSEFRARKALIFTGSIDEFFCFSEGKLSYRAQRRVDQLVSGVTWYQPFAQVNHPDADDSQPIRTIEWKHLMLQGQQPPSTIVTREFPFSPNNPDEFEYPVPIAANMRLYQEYRRRAQAVPGLVCCGRLGEFRYWDMHQAIERARVIALRLCAGINFP
jgi:UDP-galactopyranose mutase